MLEIDPEPGVLVATRRANAITTAFAKDASHGLLQLGAMRLDAGLPASLGYWRRSRVTATVSIGARDDAPLGVDSLLDFHVECALDGEVLSAAEWRALQKATSGLVLVKGRWVEVDHDKLEQALAHWRRIEETTGARGLDFAAGMRLLAGVTLDDGAAGGLDELLLELRDPERSESAHPGDALKATLQPYQDQGLRWLWLLHRLGLGACLADDMGLGKTVQEIALLLRIGRTRSKRGASLVVVPASLIGNWGAELARFAPGLKVLVAHPSAMTPAELGALKERTLQAHDVVVTSYGTLLRHAWPSAVERRVVVIDEAQAIKNPGTRQARAVKALRGGGRIALTGPPRTAMARCSNWCGPTSCGGSRATSA